MENIAKQMAKLGISDKDIRESFISSGGPGGQHVNKTASCVYLKHIPTGIEVKCQTQRSQAANRILARQILAKRIEDLYRRQVEEKRREMEKIRRQKRRPSRAARLKRLEAKKRHSLKKKLRSGREEY
ncbi:MAG: peptide chain release factor-like protein [Planctomycetota bacterium]